MFIPSLSLFIIVVINLVWGHVVTVLAMTRTNSGLRSLWGVPNLIYKRAPNKPLNLIMFTDPQSIECRAMEPGIQKIEQEYNIKILKLKITNPKNMELFQLISLNDTQNSLPLFYDRQTGNRIFGPTNYHNLEKWVKGDKRVSRRSPPIIKNKQEYLKYLEEKAREYAINQQKLENRQQKVKESSMEHQLNNIDFRYRTGFKARVEKQLALKKQTVPIKIASFLVSKLLKYDPY